MGGKYAGRTDFERAAEGTWSLASVWDDEAADTLAIAETRIYLR